MSIALDYPLKQILRRTGLLKILERTGLKAPLGRRWYSIIHGRWIAKDYLEFRRKYGSFLRYGAHLADPNKRVLVVDLAGWIPSIKQSAVWAKALQFRGWTPTILTAKSPWAVKYYRLFGFDKFFFLEDFRSVQVRAVAQAEAKAILDKELSVQEFLSRQFRDVSIGRHVLSSVTRGLHKGKIELGNPETMKLLAELLQQSLAAVQAAELLLDSVQPQMTLFHERGYTPFGEIFDVSLNRGLNTVQWFGSHRDDAFMMKRYTGETRAMHPFSLSDETWESVRQMPWSEANERAVMDELCGHYKAGTWFNRQQLQHRKKIKSRVEVQQQLGLNPSKKTAVVFSHMLWDATFFYGESLFADYEEWLVATVKAACANPAVNWVIKFHPANVWRLARDGYSGEMAEHVIFREKIGPLPEHVKVLESDTDINTFSLFDVADYGLTVRGTIGMELPCFGIPVFTAGTGRYSRRGFTIDSTSQEDYLDKLRRIHNFPKLTAEEIQLARRHAYAVFNLRPLKMQTAYHVWATDRKTDHPLDPQTVIHAHSFEELMHSPDLVAFAQWAAESQQLDYLAPSPGC